ncbi:gliding motility lipoprotein GldD [Dyadobacter chenwenxiniae]|uniref:Gliding motility lipoprotein GldD n=1 Tax=Dyadobacter chenwenxiniae TaxID=2906456 RepID=A0A9X1PJB1_9BACT|nr:gliding motility lipoprotein GldD [Dyadobacter chenwenxiniae]MCF0061400.1 gliding motility lipoprotein GldD [Dyadobacter chenwenxiniae]UON81222.1 gliding motility lipoprotein GldD [Dyadobacter chenwenxiniae]
MLKKILLFSLIWIVLASCSKKEERYVPKPKGFNRLDLPPHAYQKLTQPHPYTFEISKFAEALPDTFRTAGKDWIFINYPQFKANIQITYKEIGNNPALLKSYIDDSYKLASKHQIRASAIQEQRVMSKTGKTAILFKIEGDVPSPYQFYTTDSTKHFMRGAIYFPTATKNDSLAPVIDYLQKDMIQLLNTLDWR